MLVSVQKSPSYKVNLLVAAATSIAAVVEEVSALVPDQTESCCCDPFVGTGLDPLALSLQELLNHVPDRQDVHHLPSVGSGTEFDVSLLCQTQCLVFSCW